MNAAARKTLFTLVVAFPAAAVLVCGILDMPGRQVLGAAGLAAVAGYFVGMFAIVISDMIRSEREHRSALRRKHRICVRCGYDLRATVGRCPECGTPVVAPRAGDLLQTPTLLRIDARAEELATELECDYVGSEHLLLALFDEPEGVAARVLDNLGITAADVREELTGIGLGAAAPLARAVSPNRSTAAEARG